MKAVLQRHYGSPDLLEIGEVPEPDVPEDGVLVRVRATSVNPAEWYAVAGRPYVARAVMGLRKPKDPAVGADFAGTVERVGGRVTRLRPGDEVFGGQLGAFAEYVCVREDGAVVPKPSNLTFEQAGSVATAAITALQGLRDKGQLQAGQKVLINGASGGVGTFAVQIAKALGAEVTGVCSRRNVELVRSLGADRVVDYTREDFAASGERYDLLLDVAGSRPWSACRRVLTENGAMVLIGGPKRSRCLGPLSHILPVKLASLRASQRVVFFVAKFTRADFEALRDLLEAGKVTPVVDRTYPLSEIGAALTYLGEGHARGKVVVTV